MKWNRSEEANAENGLKRIKNQLREQTADASSRLRWIFKAKWKRSSLQICFYFVYAFKCKQIYWNILSRNWIITFGNLMRSSVQISSVQISSARFSNGTHLSFCESFLKTRLDRISTETAFSINLRLLSERISIS